MFLQTSLRLKIRFEALYPVFSSLAQLKLLIGLGYYILELLFVLFFSLFSLLLDLLRLLVELVFKARVFFFSRFEFCILLLDLCL